MVQDPEGEYEVEYAHGLRRELQNLQLCVLDSRAESPASELKACL